MRNFGVFATIVGTTLPAGCPPQSNPPATTGDNPAAGTTTVGGNCPGGVYAGDIGGVQATANVQYEQLPCSSCVEPGATYLATAGTVDSGVAQYSFTADIIGTSGYGDMVNLNANERFRIRIDLTSTGFLLTSNPFEGLVETTYTFNCR
ncbi:hypothetical protein RAS1_27480 [Phycisphaerae bacterium RAS1]|nr:hypothetical protein RAS1_27480 [Phycisphaerae bacterium RAS1]